jgi:hypothetical protein
VSARSTYPTRPTVRHSSHAAAPAVIFCTTTDDPFLSAAIAPTPTLVIGFGGKSPTPFVAPRPAAPALSFAQWHSRHATDEDKPTESGSKAELIIDSLPYHELVEPIPVSIDAVGDALCTASVRDLDISATGSSIGDALLLLKVQIEFVFDELNRRPHLSSDQQIMLASLHTYIAPHPKRLEWLASHQLAKAVPPQAGAPFCPVDPDTPRNSGGNPR